jgi:hypothetical protein
MDKKTTFAVVNCNSSHLSINSIKGIISPTHKRTEGRAPVWGSEFTSKDAALQGGSSRNRCQAERKIMGSACVVVVVVVVESYCHLAKPFIYTEIKSRQGSDLFAGHSRVLVCASVLRALPPAAPPASPHTQTDNRDLTSKDAGGPRRGFVPQAPTVQTCISAGAPGHRLKLAEGTSPRRLTYQCTDKARYICSAPLYICRIALLLLQQCRGAGLS